AAIPGASPDVGGVRIVHNRMTVPASHCYAPISVGSDSAAPSPLLKTDYVVHANVLLTRADGLLLNGGTSGAVSATTITSVRAGALCTPELPPVPIRAVNSAGV